VRLPFPYHHHRHCTATSNASLTSRKWIARLAQRPDPGSAHKNERRGASTPCNQAVFIPPLRYCLGQIFISDNTGRWLIICGDSKRCERAKIVTLNWQVADGQCAPRFTLTPQRMRIIVESFKETLELGLEKPDQVVVSGSLHLLNGTICVDPKRGAGGS
jgi:hypothetical protein